MNTTSTNLNNENEDYLQSNSQNINDLLVKTIQRIEDMRNRDEDITGVPTGFPSLDRITYGWQSSDLIVIAARPSIGKTIFALNLACNAALHTRPISVGFFNLETSNKQLVQRMLSAQSEIWLEKISRGKLEDYEMMKLYKRGIERLNNAPIFIDDTPGLNIIDLKTKSRDLKREHNIGLIIVDYLQLMNGLDESNNREQDISRITRDLKSLAKELDIPIIVLSQLSREVEKRKEYNRVPQLSDLRDSGAIEQDADIVMFLSRPEYYDITANEFGESNMGETHLTIAKHRNGSLDTVKLKALLHIQKFIEEEFDFESAQNSMNKSVFEDANLGAKLYVQKGAKMNDAEFDDGEPF